MWVCDCMVWCPEYLLQILGCVLCGLVPYQTYLLTKGCQHACKPPLTHGEGHGHHSLSTSLLTWFAMRWGSVWAFDCVFAAPAGRVGLCVLRSRPSMDLLAGGMMSAWLQGSPHARRRA